MCKQSTSGSLAIDNIFLASCSGAIINKNKSGSLKPISYHFLLALVATILVRFHELVADGWVSGHVAVSSAHLSLLAWCRRNANKFLS